MSNRMKILVAFLVLAGTIAIAVVFATLPHWWILVGSAVAKNGSGVIKDYSIYKSSSGDMVFWRSSDSLIDCYIFYAELSDIAIPNGGQFNNQLGFIAFTNEAPFPGVLSSNRVKLETDMKVVVNNEMVEFTTLSGNRIRAKR